MKRIVVALALVLSLAQWPILYAQVSEDLAFQVMPSVEIPIGPNSAVFDSSAPFRIGGALTLRGRYVLPSRPLFYLAGGLGYQVVPTPGTAPALSLVTAAAGGGVNVRVGNTMSVQSGVEAGWYLGVFGDTVGSNPHAGVSVDLGWDLSPRFSLSAGAGYRFFVGVDDQGGLTDLLQSARVSLGASFRPAGSGERTKVRIEQIGFDPVFPVFYGYYDEHPLGTVTVTNGEDSTITNVRVFFNVNEYMEQPKLSAEIGSLARGESADVRLNALFRSSVLQLITDTLVQSEIVVEYTYLGERFTRRLPHTLRIHGRNAMTWEDDRRAASFVNPKDPTVLLFSKNTAAMIRESSRDPINLNLKIAMGLFEAMRAYGMGYVIDPDSSYIVLSEDSGAIDTLLFPAESLTYRAGDCDDLAILYASLLESVGIETAFITIPGHIYLAFSLGLAEQDARQDFTDHADLLFVDGAAWVPVETTLVQDGFMRAWRIGARQWRDAAGRDAAEFWPIHDAWGVYETAPTQMPPVSLVFPTRESILGGFRQSLDEFVDRELTQALEHYRRRIELRGDSAIVRNRLGILYARYGLYEDAEREFGRSAQIDRAYVAPLVNLGNLAYLRGDYRAALEWYERAERLDPDGAAVLAGLARTRYELEQFERARHAYERLARSDPGAAAQYAYIGDQTGVSGRAAAAQDRGRTLWADPDDEEW